MNWTTIVSVGAIAIGWLVVHILSASRERVANRRKQVIDYLIGSYRKLNGFACIWASQSKATPIVVDDFNSALAEVQLLGSPDQVELARGLAECLHRGDVKTGADQLTQLLQLLRKNLRAELDLQAVESPIAHFHAEYSENKIMGEPNKAN